MTVTPHYQATHTAHGIVLLVVPSVFCAVAGTTRYHLFASPENPRRILNVPVIYLESNTLFVHELWPFKLYDLPDEAKDFSRVVALRGDDMREMVSIGCTKYTAAKIRGE